MTKYPQNKPPREPIRNASTYITGLVLLIVAGLTVAVVMGRLSLEVVIGACTTAGAILAAVWLLFERVRSMVNSPATSAQQAELRDILAQAVKQAEATGRVPATASEAANQVLEGAVRGAVPPALIAAAVAVGLPPAWAAAASPATVQAAIDAVKEATKRAPNQDELNKKALEGV